MILNLNTANHEFGGIERGVYNFDLSDYPDINESELHIEFHWRICYAENSLCEAQRT
jgi:hypothetical protein